MSRIYVQCEGPKFEHKLPAHAVLINGESAILWESYVDHRRATPVYLASCNGRFLMVQESAIVENTLRHIKLAETRHDNSRITEKEVEDCRRFV